MIYLFIFILFVIFLIIFDVGKVKKNSNLFYSIEAIILILLAGFRYRVGGDSLEYENVFYSLPDLKYIFREGFFNLEFQPFWYLLNAIVKYFSNLFVSFQIVHAILINVSIFIIINKYSRYRFTAVLFYYILIYPYFNMEILRESLAVVAFMFAYKYLLSRNYLKYYVLVFVAYLFHASAIFLFFLPFITKFLENNLSLFKVIFISIIVFLATFILSFIANLLDFNQFIQSKFFHYTSLESSTNELIKVIFQLFTIIAVMIVLKKKNISNKGMNFILNIYFMLTFASFNIVGTYRLMNYFTLFYLLIIIDLLFNYKFNTTYIKTLILFSVFSLFLNRGYYYTRDMSRYNNGLEARFYHTYIPYYSVFDPNVDMRRERIFYNTLDD